MLRWIACAFATLLLCLPAGEVSADKIKNLSSQLERSSSSKVRISAALSLAKLDGKRPILALSKALTNDESADIRRISAASLGQKMSDLKGDVRRDALTALRKAAASDKDKAVRASAKIAITKSSMEDSAGSDTDEGPAKGVLVGLTSSSSRHKKLSSKTVSLLQNTVKQVIRDKAPSSVQNAPGTGMPSNLQLKQKGLAGYSISTEVSELKMIRKGHQVTVQCGVRLQLSPWAAEGEKWVADKTATVTGSGMVTSGNSKQAIANSSDDCLIAVVAQVTSNQVVPFLATKTRSQRRR